MRVIVDFVVNHTSEQHPWFRSARSSRDNPYRDFYVWRDDAAREAGAGRRSPARRTSVVGARRDAPASTTCTASTATSPT